jgi:hypothetical protein
VQQPLAASCCIIEMRFFTTETSQVIRALCPSGEEYAYCQALIEAHKVCLRLEGFNVSETRLCTHILPACRQHSNSATAHTHVVAHTHTHTHNSICCHEQEVTRLTGLHLPGYNVVLPAAQLHQYPPSPPDCSRQGCRG